MGEFCRGVNRSGGFVSEANAAGLQARQDTGQFLMVSVGFSA